MKFWLRKIQKKSLIWIMLWLSSWLDWKNVLTCYIQSLYCIQHTALKLRYFKVNRNKSVHIDAAEITLDIYFSLFFYICNLCSFVRFIDWCQLLPKISHSVLWRHEYGYRNTSSNHCVSMLYTKLSKIQVVGNTHFYIQHVCLIFIRNLYSFARDFKVHVPQFALAYCAF